MQTQAINNFSFGNKNTFLQKSKSARTNDDVRKFKSLHYYALERAHNIKYLAAKKELKTVNNFKPFSLFKILGKILKERVKISFYKFKWWDELPQSFYEPETKITKQKKHVHYELLNP